MHATSAAAERVVATSPLTDMVGHHHPPLRISEYRCRAGGGTGRHRHKADEKCHVTILAAGAVEVTSYDARDLVMKIARYEAPCVIDYDGGEDRCHKIVAMTDGTVFFNIPRAG